MWTLLLIVITTLLGYYIGGHFPDAHGNYHEYLGGIVGFIIGVLLRFGGFGVDNVFDVFDD